jgi:hypothetical protein
MFQIDESSFISSNTIPYFDEIQENSSNEERKSQQFPYLSERNRNDNTSTIKVKKKILFYHLFF